VFDVRLPGGVTAVTFGDVATNTAAVFTDLTYDLGDMFSISAADATPGIPPATRVLRQTYLGGGSPSSAGPAPCSPPPPTSRGTGRFEQFTPRASLTSSPMRTTRSMQSWSKGFKGGGFDPRGQSSAAPDLNGARHPQHSNLRLLVVRSREGHQL
jgi:iron complex outermembrane receptor protein